MRAVVEPEGSMLMPYIGCSGEWIFPDTGAGMFSIRPSWWCASDWWYDRYAVASWLQYQYEAERPTRADWVQREQSRITKGRLALYSEKWLQTANYYPSIRFNALDVASIMEENAEGLKTILFSIPPGQDAYAEAQARRYPTWCGAEGPYNLLVNARKAKAQGMAGVLCGILWPHYGLTTVEPWVYGAIKQAIQAWKDE
jgi:hypothetical protein